MTVYGILCNELPDPEKAVGFNVSFGANYEFKLSDNWRLRNEFMVYNSSYDKSEYDDLYLAYNVGGRYIFKGGEVFTGLAMNRRWLDHTPYSYSVGVKVNSGSLCILATAHKDTVGNKPNDKVGTVCCLILKLGNMKRVKILASLCKILVVSVPRCDRIIINARGGEDSLPKLFDSNA